METIGQTLHETREKLGLSLDEVERATHIRGHHLEALERGDFDALPSSVQARGFLRNYAEFLGLDAEAILLHYADHLQARGRRSRPKNETISPPSRPAVEVRSRRPFWLSSDVFVAALITVAVVAVLVWGGSRVVAALGSTEGTEEAASDFLIPTFTPTITLTPEPDGTPLPTAPQAQAPLAVEGVASPTSTLSVEIEAGVAVDVRLVLQQRAWILVLVDGNERYRGRAAAGEILEFQAQQSIEVVTGNAAALRVIYNGQDQGVLGELAQVAIRIWTEDGVITPTPSPSPSASPTSSGETG